MDADRWSVLVVTRDGELGKAVLSALTRADVHPALLTNSETALMHSAREQANVFVVAMDAGPVAGVEWVRRFRRGRHCKSYKAPIVLLAPSLSPSFVESCRDAGASALVGLPLSPRTLVKTIKRVFAQSTPFIDTEEYVGPCRRANIITAWPPAELVKYD